MPDAIQKAGSHTRRESRRHFRARVRSALADPELQRALRHAMTQLREKHDAAFAGVDFEVLRQDLKRRRAANLERLPSLLEDFRQRWEAAGGTYHFAPDAASARQIVGSLCSRAGADLVVKSKSMATEEVGLDAYLESLGLEVVESDLGERLVQLDHSRPSHIVAPAIHLSKERAAELMGTEPTLAAIQAQARRSLRNKFLEAGVGITGANLAVAETGSLVLVTNEGNAALTATLPPVHIAVFGTDKVVATLEDAVAVLRLLPRSATGQTSTAYVDWITGPSRSADVEQSLAIGVHGPREVHCVVVDNGRERMRADPLFSEALHCIRCGACSNVCPPFMAVGGHQFGHIYTGPIGLVLTPFHHGPAAADLPNSLCCQCDACQAACPVDIPLPRQILEHRRKTTKPLGKRILLEAWAHPGGIQAAMTAAGPVATTLRPPADRLAAKPLRRRLAVPPTGTVNVFASCLVDRFLPEVGQALITILRAADLEVGFAPQQWCCGLVCANAGEFAAAARLANGLTAALRGTAGPIVTPSTSCFAAFTQDAPSWGVGREQAPVAARFRDATRFVLQLLEDRPDLVPRARPTARVAYHDSCQSLRKLGLAREPRRLLELAGYEVVEMPPIANCCGFGGTFSQDWPEVADRLLDWKLEALASTQCELLASDNPGCLLHIAAGVRMRRLGVRVAHVLELVAARLQPPEGGIA